MEGVCMLHSYANIQNMQCADFVFRCLNKTAPEVFHNLIKKVDHQKTTSVNEQTLNIPMVGTENTKGGLFFSDAKIYNALLMHLKAEKFYLPFKQGLKEHYGLIIF